MLFVNILYGVRLSVELAALEANKKVVSCKWLYKVKFKLDGNVDRYKARLVARGFTQTEGLDYFDTFAPVAKMATVRVLLSLAAVNGWSVTQMDVNAFLHGQLQEEVYMAIPPGYVLTAEHLHSMTDRPLVCRLIKSIYGLKQAPRVWAKKFCSVLLSYGFTQTHTDHSLFVYRSDLITKIKAYLSTHFKIKDLGPLKYFLGIEIARSVKGFYLNQRKYSLDIIKDVGFESAKASLVPI